MAFMNARKRNLYIYIYTEAEVKLLNEARFEVFTAVTMKNAVFWDIKTPVRTSQETH
jgi:hypothetical protein